MEGIAQVVPSFFVLLSPYFCIKYIPFGKGRKPYRLILTYNLLVSVINFYKLTF
ncbi:MAG: hypothetical protein JWQ25_2627 [Daejeonella sp.]|nr:hypothetical protein [Daejeonella sp.]